MTLRHAISNDQPLHQAARIIPLSKSGRRKDGRCEEQGPSGNSG